MMKTFYNLMSSGFKLFQTKLLPEIQHEFRVVIDDWSLILSILIHSSRFKRGMFTQSLCHNVILIDINSTSNKTSN